MNWDDLRFVLALSRARGLNSAARVLGVNASSVYRRLEALETSMGVRLFERLRTGYRLTDAGEELTAAASRMELEALVVERRVLGADVRLQGSMRLATSEALMIHVLADHVEEFRALYPDVEVLVVARFEAQAELARKLGATVIGHTPASQVIEAAAAWSGGVLRLSDGLPMAFPGGIDVVYDTVGKQETFEVGTRVLKARGTLVKAGVHGPTWWEDTPLYFKEISMVGSNAFGVEAVDGVRRHGIEHYLELVAGGRVDLSEMLTHRYALDGWRDAFTALATQDTSGAIKVAFDFREDT